MGRSLNELSCTRDAPGRTLWHALERKSPQTAAESAERGTRTREHTPTKNPPIQQRRRSSSAGRSRNASKPLRGALSLASARSKV